MKNIIILFSFVVLITAGCKKSSDNPNDPDNFYGRSVGASANELLSESQFKSLRIEIQYMTGYPLSAASISHIQSFLSSLVNKSAGITVVTREIAPSASTTLNINEVANLEKANRTVYAGGNEISVYILVTNGVYSDNNVIGASYRNASIVLFGKKIYDNSGGIGQTGRTKLESAVLDHEFGHLLGLVDLGSSMQTNHKDAAHGNHCNNSNCLMYYQADTQDMLGVLLSGSTPVLDANCLADLRANGGK